MTVSPYFRHISADNEQDLVDALTIELIQQRGIDLVYIPREATTDLDFLFGEDPENRFASGHTIEMYPENMQGFEGEGDFMAGFGLDIRDEATFIVSKTRFNQVVSKAVPTITRAREGDLISYPLSKAVFEITFVEHEKPFYQIGKGHVYHISAKRFEFSHEDIDVGEDVVDGIPAYPDGNDDADDIQTESDTVINFDESDPFSENSY